MHVPSQRRTRDACRAAVPQVRPGPSGPRRANPGTKSQLHQATPNSATPSPLLFTHTQSGTPRIFCLCTRCLCLVVRVVHAIPLPCLTHARRISGSPARASPLSQTPPVCASHTNPTTPRIFCLCTMRLCLVVRVVHAIPSRMPGQSAAHQRVQTHFPKHHPFALFIPIPLRRASFVFERGLFVSLLLLLSAPRFFPPRPIDAAGKSPRDRQAQDNGRPRASQQKASLPTHCTKRDCKGRSQPSARCQVPHTESTEPAGCAFHPFTRTHTCMVQHTAYSV